MPSHPNIPANVLPQLDDNDTLDWNSLLHRQSAPADPAALAEPFTGRRILITGAAGSIGSALAKSIACFHPERLILLDSAEHGLYELQIQLQALPFIVRFATIPGSVCDAPLVREILGTHHPHVVYHAAAYKHVPLMERHPLAAIQNNTLGTYTIAQACVAAGIPKLILLSTDKAVAPSSIMGAAKRLAELAVLALNSNNTQTKALRLGNVLGSRGSVVPLFRSQIESGGPITVTHPQVSRYFLPLRESIERLLALAQLRYTSGIFIPRIDHPILIMDLADFLIKNFAADAEIPITFTGLRSGDKMHEALLAPGESVVESIDKSSNQEPLLHIQSPQPPPDLIFSALQEMKEAIQQRNHARALEILQTLLPDYHPSDLVRRHVATSVSTL